MVGGQAEDEVGGQGTRPGIDAEPDVRAGIEAEPDETSDAAKADSFGSQPRSVARGGACHFSEVVHGAKFHVTRARQLAHGLELAGNTFASGNTGLGAAIEDFFDSVESGVVDTFSEGEVERAGGSGIVKGEHLKGFEDGKGNAPRRMDGGGIER